MYKYEYSPFLLYCTFCTKFDIPSWFVASWSRGKHLTLGSGGPGFESWMCQLDVESLGKALYMHFLTPFMCKMNTGLGSTVE